MGSWFWDLEHPKIGFNLVPNPLYERDVSGQAKKTERKTKIDKQK